MRYSSQAPRQEPLSSLGHNLLLGMRICPRLFWGQPHGILEPSLVPSGLPLNSLACYSRSPCKLQLQLPHQPLLSYMSQPCWPSVLGTHSILARGRAFVTALPSAKILFYRARLTYSQLHVPMRESFTGVTYLTSHPQT